MTHDTIRRKITESPPGSVYRVPFKPKRGKKDYSEAEARRTRELAEKVGRSAQRG